MICHDNTFNEHCVWIKEILWYSEYNFGLWELMRTETLDWIRSTLCNVNQIGTKLRFKCRQLNLLVYDSTCGNNFRLSPYPCLPLQQWFSVYYSYPHVICILTISCVLYIIYYICLKNIVSYIFWAKNVSYIYAEKTLCSISLLKKYCFLHLCWN